jgi:succinyl-diaminopimelate desuccinylase
MSVAAPGLTEAEHNELVTLLQRLIQFPTEDPPGREIELARFVHDILTASGITSDLIEFQPGRANVVARLKGRGERPGLVFSAHFDTLPAGRGAWQFPPFEGQISEGRVHGRGASDIKSGMAAMIAAAQRIAQDKLPLKGDLILAFSAGESSNLLGARHMVLNGNLEGAGALLVSELSSLEIFIAEKGALWVKAIAAGAPGHPSGAAGAVGAGDNAILKLVEFINQLREWKPEAPAHPLLGEPSLSVGTITGGSAINITPDHAELGLDIRYVPGMSAQDILSQLQALADADITFEILDDKPPVETLPNHPFVRLCQEACRSILGREPSVGGVPYFSDAAILSPALGLPWVIIGPGETGMSGQRDEYVTLDKLFAAADIYMQIATNYLLS